MTKKEIYVKHMLFNKKSMLIFILIILGIKLPMVIKDEYNAIDYMVLCIQGFSFKKVHMMNVLYYLAYFVFPIFIVLCFLENEKKDANILAKFRLNRRKEWDKLITKVCYGYLFKYSMCYWLVLFVITIMLKLLLGESKSIFYDEFKMQYGVNNKQMNIYILSTVVLHIVELFVFFEIAYLIYKMSKNTILAFVCLVLINVFVIVFQINIIVNPLGSSSLYNLIEQNRSLLLQIVINLLWAVTLIIARRKIDENSDRVKKCQ